MGKEFRRHKKKYHDKLVEEIWQDTRKIGIAQASVLFKTHSFIAIADDCKVNPDMLIFYDVSGRHRHEYRLLVLEAKAEMEGTGKNKGILQLSIACDYLKENWASVIEDRISLILKKKDYLNRGDVKLGAIFAYKPLGLGKIELEPFVEYETLGRMYMKNNRVFSY